VIRRELATDVADKLDLPARSIHLVLDTALALLIEELVQSGRLEWRGLGTFTVRTYPARKIHVPATGKTVTLPPRRSVNFKPSARLRARLVPTRRRQAPRR
jgi:nucleoid DNA-binding protein